MDIKTNAASLADRMHLHEVRIGKLEEFKVSSATAASTNIPASVQSKLQSLEALVNSMMRAKAGGSSTADGTRSKTGVFGGLDTGVSLDEASNWLKVD